MRSVSIVALWLLLAVISVACASPYSVLHVCESVEACRGGQLAVAAINSDIAFTSANVTVDLVQVNATAGFAASDDACTTLIQTSIAGIVTSYGSSDLDEYFAEYTALPVVTTARYNTDTLVATSLVSVPAPNTELGLALASAVRYFNWTIVGVVVEQDAGSEAAAAAFQAEMNRAGIAVRFSLSVAPYFASAVFSSLGNSQVRVIVLICATCDPILAAANAAGLTGADVAWLTTAGNFSSGSGPSGSVSSDTLPDGVLSMGAVTAGPYKAVFEGAYLSAYPNSPQSMDAALAYDGVQMMARAILRTHQLAPFTPPIDSNACNATHGVFSETPLIISYLKNTYAGATASITVDTQNAGTSAYGLFNFQQGAPGTFHQVATWTSAPHYDFAPFGLAFAGSIIWPSGTNAVPTSQEVFQGRTLSVLLKPQAPFVFFDPNRVGNQRYSGYDVDVINLIAGEVGFDVDISNVTADTSSNTMVALAANGTYNIIAGFLSITSTRATTVDFSQPYYSLGARMLVLKQTRVSLWEFSRPFHWGLWLTWLVVVVVAANVLYCVERQRPDRAPAGYCAGTFSAGFKILGLMVRADDTNPGTVGGRTVVWALRVCALILVASYTANLATYLRVTVNQSKISSWDLVKAGQIPAKMVGVTAGGSNEAYLISTLGASKYTKYPSRSAYIDALAKGEILVAVDDAPILEYLVLSDCRFDVRGGLFNYKGYGLGTRKDSPLTPLLSNAILHLDEIGAFTPLTVKWFGANQCVASGENLPLLPENLGGLFIVVACFGAVSLLIHYRDMKTLPDRRTAYFNKVMMVGQGEDGKKVSTSLTGAAPVVGAKEGMILLDATALMRQPAAAGSNVTRDALVRESLVALFQRLEQIKLANRDESLAGVHIVAFSEDRAIDLGEVALYNIGDAWSRLPFTGHSRIMPAWRALIGAHYERHGGESFDARPTLNVLLITCGHVADRNEFHAALGRAGGKVALTIALVGQGPSYEAALQESTLMAVNNALVTTLPMGGMRDANEMADIMLQVVV